MRMMVPYTAEWEKKANRVARNFVDIRVCIECGYPHVKGYCCMTCGSSDPDGVGEPEKRQAFWRWVRLQTRIPGGVTRGGEMNKHYEVIDRTQKRIGRVIPYGVLWQIPEHVLDAILTPEDGKEFYRAWRQEGAVDRKDATNLHR